MAWIYGGGDTIGQIYDAAYDPTMLLSGASQAGLPVIFVVMNYRLGVFGFAASPALQGEDSLNAGLKHIADFGGDPDNVTIFGESDGATGVGLQITAFGGQNGSAPFSRAIMQSGAASADVGTASNQTMMNTQALVSVVNCTRSDSTEELSCLRGLPLSTLLASAIEYELQVNSFAGLDVFIPTAPSTFIPDSPSALLSSGRFSRGIDIITGWNEDDGSLFTPYPIESDSDVANSINATISGISNQTIERILALYPVSSFTAQGNTSAQFSRASRIQRDFGFTCPSLLMVQANIKYSGPGTANYLFALNQTLFEPLLAAYNLSYLGVPHFSDIPYVFNQATTRYVEVASQSDIVLSSEMSSSWASFATSGDPSQGNLTLAGWLSEASAANSSAAGYDDYGVRVIGGPRAGMRYLANTTNAYDEDLASRCAFWNSKEILALLGV